MKHKMTCYLEYETCFSSSSLDDGETGGTVMKVRMQFHLHFVGLFSHKIELEHNNGFKALVVYICVYCEEWKSYNLKWCCRSHASAFCSCGDSFCIGSFTDFHLMAWEKLYFLWTLSCSQYHSFSLFKEKFQFIGYAFELLHLSPCVCLVLVRFENSTLRPQ